MTNALEIKNIRKKRGDFALTIEDLTLPSGCIMGLIGENGAGKSTTIQLILDTLRKDGGTIRVLGQEDIASVKQDLGVVLDEVGFPDCLNPLQIEKIMEDIFTRWDHDLYQQLLKKFSLTENKKFKEFSKGMKMKLGIAVALSHHPRLLLLDEPTSGLDPVARDELLDIFADFTRNEEHSILISSHIVSDLEKICDYIAFLHKGKLCLCQEKDSLRESFGIWHGTPTQLETLPPHAVYGKRKTAYDTQALVRRDAVGSKMELSPIGIEDLFIFMAREDQT